MAKETPRQTIRRMDGIILDTQASFQIMCDAHAQLVEREQAHVLESANLRSVIYEIFMRTTDHDSYELAARTLGITPVPKLKFKANRRSRAKR